MDERRDKIESMKAEKMDNLRVALLLRLLIQERLGARQLVRKSLLFACERKDIFIRKDENQNKLCKSG